MALPIVEFDPFGGRSVVARPVRPDDLVAVSYTHLTLPTNREV